MGLAKPVIRNNVTPDALLRARNMIFDASDVVVLTGAGISTDSGIPDFRGPNGLWTKSAQAAEESNIASYVARRDIRLRSWQGQGLNVMHGKPNVGHRAITHLQGQGRLERVITQNVDGLHQAAGVEGYKVIEYHGNLRECACTACDFVAPIQHALDMIAAGNPDPHCECGFPLGANVVRFGDYVPENRMIDANNAISRSDLVVVAGTSLSVPPFKFLVSDAFAAHKPIIIVNQQSTEMDRFTTLQLRGSISEILPQIIN